MTLHDLLSDAQIRLPKISPGSNSHIICPKCGGGSTREKSLSVTIDEDGEGFTAICHRATCGYRSGKRTQPDQTPRRPAAPRPMPPPPHAETAMRNRPDWLYEFFAARNIGAKTVNDFEIYAVRRSFSDQSQDAIVFPYHYAGEVVNRKYRPYPVKGAQMQERNALPTIYNIDRLGQSPETIYWVEGEPDVLALYECGYTSAVSLKDGAPSPGQHDDKRYAALTTHEAVFKAAKKVILAGDMDAPGLALREELARRLGRHRCWLVTWPDDCKDACDVLRIYGPDAVAKAIDEAVPYPIEGLQTVTPGMLVALKHAPMPQTMTTGTGATDAILSLPTEGRLIVVSGWPGSGKSAWTRYCMIHTMRAHNRVWAVFSPEMQPWQEYVAGCAEVYCRKPFYGSASFGAISDEEASEAERFFQPRLTMIASDAEEESLSIDWILDKIRIATLRSGVTDALIDPWNEVAHDRPRDMSETDYIGRMLQKLKAFGLRHGVNIWIVVHPTKPVGLKHGEKTKAVGPYDIASSAHWFNKADVGITLHVPQDAYADLHTWKLRFKRYGRRNEVAQLDFNAQLGTYSTGSSRPEGDH